MIGSGGAGMYAAIEAARAGCRVLLIDRSLIGRGGATVMAQMTVAVALGAEAPDHWSHHYQDTLTAGRGLCNEALARLLCEEGPDCIREMDAWGVGWARKNGHITQAFAPGTTARAASMSTFSTPARRSRRRAHGRPQDRQASARPATSAWSTSSSATAKSPARPPGMSAPARLCHLGQGDHRRDRRADAALPPQQRLGQYGRRRLCAGLRAGAPLIDMEFVQFFPIGHLAPRLIGMDPIMWDPFRYKLGGRLLNGDMRGIHRPLRRGRGRQVRHHPRPCHLRDHQGGRSRSRLAAWRRVSELPALPEEKLREAFGPVIDRLAANGIDLTRMPVEVAPIAHYHMGGVAADVRMQPSCRACSSPAKRSAAPMAPTGFPATPSPRRWCSAARPAAPLQPGPRR